MYRSHKGWKEIVVFIKRHTVICVLCMICAFIIAKYSHIPVPNWFPSMFICPADGTAYYEWLKLLNNLSLAFVGSIITYIIIQYIPERRRAYNSYIVLKKEIYNLYSFMSRLIDMYLFEMEIQDSEEDLSEGKLEKICQVEISNKFKACGIEYLKNGVFANTTSHGYNLYEDSKHYTELVYKAIDKIKGTVCSGQLDSDIINTISIIENNWFLHFISDIDIFYIHIPGYRNVILDFNKGFYELIKCHRVLSNYDIDLITYKFSKMSDEEIQSGKEMRLLRSSRVDFKIEGVSKAKSIAKEITELTPTEERLNKSEGVMFEMLVYYDSEAIKPKEILNAALTIAEYIEKNRTDDFQKNYALLNKLQIKKRLGTISTQEKRILYNIAKDTNVPDVIVFFAAILCENYEKAADSFSKFSEKEKACFIQFPIYRLWPNPPLQANLNPVLFTVNK